MDITVSGKNYELIGKVGVGGQGTVYKVKDRLENPYALKVFHYNETSELIEREIETLKQIDHSSIIKVYDSGSDSEAFNSLSWLLMEYANCGNILEYMKSSKVNVEEKMDFIIETTSAVNYIHNMGILHRDIKPHNILINDSGNGHKKAYLCDFSMSKRDNDKRLAYTGKGMGTFLYVAPEVLTGIEEHSRVSDIYSLGLSIYEILTGKKPYDNGYDLVKKIYDNLKQEPPSLYDKSIPKKLDEICLKCMELDQKKRYQSGEDILKDLNEVRIYENSHHEVVSVYSSILEENYKESSCLMNNDDTLKTTVLGSLFGVTSIIGTRLVSFLKTAAVLSFLVGGGAYLLKLRIDVGLEKKRLEMEREERREHEIEVKNVLEYITGFNIEYGKYDEYLNKKIQFINEFDNKIRFVREYNMKERKYDVYDLEVEFRSRKFVESYSGIVLRKTIREYMDGEMFSFQGNLNVMDENFYDFKNQSRKLKLVSFESLLKASISSKMENIITQGASYGVYSNFLKKYLTIEDEFNLRSVNKSDFEDNMREVLRSCNYLSSDMRNYLKPICEAKYLSFLHKKLVEDIPDYEHLMIGVSEMSKEYNKKKEQEMYQRFYNLLASDQFFKSIVNIADRGRSTLHSDKRLVLMHKLYAEYSNQKEKIFRESGKLRDFLLRRDQLVEYILKTYEEH